MARGLDSIDRNAKLQSQLTGNLLDISKALTGRLLVESTPVRLDDVVKQAVDSAQPAAIARSVTIDCHVPDSPIAVLGDWSRLRQIVWHLLTNALKFTPLRGSIEISLRAEKDEVVLSVFDSGSGIDPEFLPRIFDRFTQEDASTTRIAGGLGVGLSLVRELVQLHGGEISAANRADGRGAVFTVRFPAQPADILANAGRHREEAASGSPLLDGVRVLVLDKDSECRELVEAILQQRGATVRTTASVEDALESLESWRPDVLVSDNGCPEDNAYAVFGKVPALEAERGGRIPALALTHFGRTDQRVRGMLASVLLDLPKPVDPALLTSEIARLAGREPRREAH
jgi:CheY-like chemotaxis protein